MSDSIQGPPKTVQQSHKLRTVRTVKMNEERSDEDRHLAELEERMRNAKRRREDPEVTVKGQGGTQKAAKSGVGKKVRPSQDGHIDFTA